MPEINNLFDLAILPLYFLIMLIRSPGVFVANLSIRHQKGCGIRGLRYLAIKGKGDAASAKLLREYYACQVNLERKGYWW